MDTTPSNIEGTSLDPSLVALPNNIYGRVETAPPPPALAQAFIESGWKVRKSSTTDFEIESNWASIEFVCTGRAKVSSFAGVIESRRVPELIALLVDVGVSSAVELYDSDGRTILHRYA